MNGLLRDYPLVELINEVADAGHSGALRVAREPARGVVYALGGRVVHATTNLRAHRLAESLKRWGAVGDEGLGELASKKLSDEELASELVRAGLFMPGEASAFAARLSEDALRAMLMWADGGWEFDPRARAGVEASQAPDTPSLVLEAARRMPAEFVASRFAEGERVAPSGRAPEGISLSPEEGFVLSRVDAPTSVAELLAFVGLPEAQALQAVYVLALAGLVARPDRRRALPSDAAALKSAAAAAPKSADATKSATPAPKAAAEAPAVKDDEARKEEADPRKEFEALLGLAAAKTHYGVLGVTRGARDRDIKAAYYALAKRFHPDRFRRDLDAAQVERAASAFSRLTRAYEVLKNSSTRSAYDLKLDKEAAANASRPSAPAEGAYAHKGGGSAADAETAAAVRAEERFRQGVAALDRGDVEGATRLLAEAVALAPRRAPYRAHYGRALGRSRDTRRQAEAELSTAIMLEARDVSYRVMLAEFYRDVGLRRRAEGELERALAVDPSHAPARQLLETLRSGR
ncbi:MAG TPA: DnaJ domain-containing protein [Pyrinomonadaceae bacterium]|nr:DnaJ domain-containing protein [Pyrinomonadaceae bacterium]